MKWWDVQMSMNISAFVSDPILELIEWHTGDELPGVSRP